MSTIAALNADGEKVMVTPLDGEGRSSVQEALAAVMGELPNIGKGDKSPEGYQYRGIEAITKHAQPLFAKHGIVIAPKASITDVRPSPAMKDGWQDVFMTVEWTITGPDGSTLTAQTTGIGRDRSDKGANKAQTQAYKYLLLHLLCIADHKDDADGQTYEADRVEYVEDPAVPGLRSSILAAIEKLDDARKAALAEWIKEQRLPAVRRMNAAQCERVIDHLMELDETDEGSGDSTDSESSPTDIPDPSEGEQ